MASEKRVVRKGVRVEAGAEGGGRSERERPERVRRVLFGGGGAGMVMVGGGVGGGGWEGGREGGRMCKSRWVFLL